MSKSELVDSLIKLLLKLKQQQDEQKSSVQQQATRITALLIDQQKLMKAFQYEIQILQRKQLGLRAPMYESVMSERLDSPQILQNRISSS